jgi:hypothetical protein
MVEEELYMVAMSGLQRKGKKSKSTNMPLKTPFSHNNYIASTRFFPSFRKNMFPRHL